MLALSLVRGREYIPYRTSSPLHFQYNSECYLFSRFVYHRSFLSSQVTSQVICILHNPRDTREYRPYIVIINSI